MLDANCVSKMLVRASREMDDDEDNIAAEPGIAAAIFLLYGLRVRGT